MQSIHKHLALGKKFNVYNTSQDGAVVPLTKMATWAESLVNFKKNVDINKLIIDNRAKLSQEEAAQIIVEGCRDRNKATAIKWHELYLKLPGEAEGLGNNLVIKFGDISEVNPLDWADIVGAIDESDYRDRVDELLGKNREQEDVL
jgi:hypothetical protein